MAGKQTARYTEQLKLYDKLVATNGAIERKGATMPYTSVNGNMFSLLTKDGTLILRLSEADREAFVKKYKTAPVVQYGAVMREYVAIPDALLARTATLAKLFEVSYRYASALKPKATSKTAASKKKRG